MTKLQQLAEQLKNQAQPPVHTWKPDNLGSIDILIDQNGFWYHEGERIVRDRLVRLFSSILWHEQERYFLVTPAEKLKIEVEDVPFVVQQAELVDQAWVLSTNTGDKVIVGNDNPVQLRAHADQLIPYVRVRYDLWARFNRSVYFQLVTLAMETQSGPPFTLTSDRYEFVVADELAGDGKT